jgi:hypothetical protein
MDLEGTIKRIDVPKSTVIVAGPDAKEVSITVNPGAKVTLEGKSATLAALRAGQRAKVTHTENKASAVEATGPKTK